MTLSLIVSALLGLCKNLPQILQLISTVQAHVKQEEVAGTVSATITSLHGAVLAKDSKKFNDIFNSK